MLLILVVRRQKNNVRYPYNDKVELRKHSDVIAALKFMEQDEKIEKIKGVHGATPLLLVHDFDVVWGCPVDYMHCCLLGIMKLLLWLWFDSKNHK